MPVNCRCDLEDFSCFLSIRAGSYLSKEDVQGDANPFVQLVSGVVWLLRNGEVYIKESMEAECNKTQETGNNPPPGTHTHTDSEALPPY